MKKTDSYNKYVPLFIDNYAEQRSAKLRARMGWAGYGIYLAILQRLRSEKDCVLELDYETLAFSFWTDEDTLRTIIEDFGLFVIDRKNRTFSSPLLEEMLRTIDPALSKSRNKKCSLQVPATENITHDVSAESEEKAVSDDENSMEYPANEDITHDISGVSEEKTVSADENSMEYPANEDITSSPRACVCVNKQTNEQTNEQEKEERRKIFSLPSLFSEGEESGEEQTEREGQTCEAACVSTKDASDSCERKGGAFSKTIQMPLKRSVVMPKKGTVRGARRRTPVYLNPPTVEEVAAYARHLGYADFQADRFVAYYAANGWKTTRHDMMNWHAAVSTWHLNQCRYAEERAQQAKQKAEQQERRELHYQQDREWRNRVFLERNASQEQQDRLFHQQRQQFLQQQVVQAITSQEDKYALPPCVPF